MLRSRSILIGMGAVAALSTAIIARAALAQPWPVGVSFDLPIHRLFLHIRGQDTERFYLHAEYGSSVTHGGDSVPGNRRAS